MADVNLSPYTAEQQAMDRRRKMAEAMQQQAVAPIEMPTVPGAKVSHLQGLAKLLQGYIAGKNLDRADQEQKDYENQMSGEMAHLFSNLGQYQTVKGEQTSPAVPAEIIPAVENQENLDRKNVILYNSSHRTNQSPSIGMVNNGTRLDESGNNTFMPSSVTSQQIIDANDLPRYTSEEQIKTPAKPATFAADRQIPLLNASFLDPTNPNAYKTGQVRTMLAQYLMQQEAQKQAAAQRALEAQQAIHVGKPGETFFRIGADGKPITVANTPATPSFEKVETINAKGQKIVKYVDKAKLGELGDVLAPYTGMIDHLMQAQNLPEVIKNNPDALRLVGSFLGKESGDVTSADFAKVMIGLNETNARLRYEGIPPVTTDIVKGKNIMIPSVDLPPKGSPLEIGKVYNTPKGQARWNGTKFVTID
jgi:hypothetical protein